MVNVCAVKDCLEEDTPEAKTVGGVTFHKFPNDPDARKRWLAAINRDDLAKGPIAFSYLRVCSRHFLNSDFMDRGKLVLMPDAVPTEKVVSDKSDQLVVASVSSLAEEGSSSQDQEDATTPSVDIPG